MTFQIIIILISFYIFVATIKINDNLNIKPGRNIGLDNTKDDSYTKEVTIKGTEKL